LSNAKDIFFDLLSPRIEEAGYKFKKSKACFEKSNGDLSYTILISWDGRGGITFLNSVTSKIHIPKILNASKKLVGVWYETAIWQGTNSCIMQRIIPQMYSKELFDLAT
jgi:hypothetical protein